MDPHSGYLKSKIDPVLQPLMFELLREKPSDPVDFMISWLETTLGKKEQKPKQEKKEEEVGSEEENITDEEDGVIGEIELEKKRVSIVRRSVSAETYGLWNKRDAFVPRVVPKSEAQLKELRDTFRMSFVFAALDLKELEVVIQATEEKKFKAGETVIKQGEEGDNLYVVSSGTLECTKKLPGSEAAKLLREYGPGDAFGELALLYNAPRAATITAKTDCVLWCLDRQTFTHIVKDTAINKRKKYQDFLKSVGILSTLDIYELTKVMDAVRPAEYKAGETIIKEGDTGNIFFLLETGEAYATKQVEPGKEAKQVMEYKKGSYFGELALLSNAPRAATVLAKTDCVCLTLDRHAFKRLLGPLDNILKRNAQVYGQYLLKL